MNSAHGNIKKWTIDNEHLLEVRSIDAEFQRWLKKNNNHLRFYAPDEIASLALLCGFDLKEVCGGIPDHLAHIKRLLSFWESPILAEKWMRLQTLDHGTDE